MITIVTNIDTDHLVTYGNDFSFLCDTFIKFIEQLPFYGLAVLCIDDPVVHELLPRISRPKISYGFSAKADIQVINYRQQGMQSHFSVKRKNHEKPLDIVLNLAGKHNVLNALAAIAVATELNVKDEIICQAMSHFGGVGRRFNVSENLITPVGRAILIDDYGHHPREIELTISNVRHIWPEKRLVMIFQPHRYTRTRALLKEFAEVLAKVDVLLLLPVYAASEEPISGADSKALSEHINPSAACEIHLIDSEANLKKQLLALLREDDVILTQGAGSIGEMSEHLLQQWTVN